MQEKEVDVGERSRSRRTVRVGIERIGVKVDGQKVVEVGVM